jgi:hypothetical protein
MNHGRDLKVNKNGGLATNQFPVFKLKTKPVLQDLKLYDLTPPNP